MSSDGVLKRLYDIRDNIILAHEFVAGMNFQAFADDKKTYYATVRALEIISEAVRFIPKDMKARHPSVDWVAVRDAGNIYRHSYELVSEERIWETVTKHLDSLDMAVLSEIGKWEGK